MQIYSFSCKKRLWYLKLDFLYFRHKVPWNKCTLFTEGSRIWLTLLLRSLWNTVHIKKKQQQNKNKKTKNKTKKAKKTPKTTLLCFTKKCDSNVSVLDFCLFFEDNDLPMNKDEDIFNVKTYNYDRMSYMSNAKF